MKTKSEEKTKKSRKELRKNLMKKKMRQRHSYPNMLCLAEMELRGIEPLSESPFIKASPIAVALFLIPLRKRRTTGFFPR